MKTFWRRKKKMNRKYKKLSSNISFSIYGLGFLLCTFILFTSVGFSAINTELSISGDAVFRVEADIRIMDCKLIGTTNGGVEEYSSGYSKYAVTTGVVLPNLDSTVTYEISVTNFVSIEMLLSEIKFLNFSNENMEYVLSGIAVNDTISGMATHTFQITIQYKSTVTTVPENQVLESKVEFTFIENDTTPPIISEVTPKAKTFYISKTDQIDLASYAVANDDVDGNITQNIEITTPLGYDKNKPGSYEIVYNVKDKAGNHAIPLKVKIVIWNFQKISSGNYHTLALTSHGKVYVWGYGAVYKCGLGSTSDVRVPTLIPGLDNIVDISAARESSYAVDGDGNLWVWGSNGSYRLGDDTSTTRQTPWKVPPPDGEKYIQVSVHYATGAALTEKGNVYTWGLESYGATGFGNATTLRKPTQLTTLSNIKKISMGYYNGAAIDGNGDLYVWGTNGEGQLGLGYMGANSSAGIALYRNTPIKHPTLTNIKDVGYGVYHGVAVTNSGEVYTWGTNAYGRIGNGSASTNAYTPVQVSVSNVISCSINEYNTSVVTSSKEVYAWGSNNYGEAGIGSVTANVITPTSNPQVTGAIADSFALDSSFILTEDSEVYGFGYGGNYVLGNNLVGSTPLRQLWSFTAPDPE